MEKRIQLMRLQNSVNTALDKMGEALEENNCEKYYRWKTVYDMANKEINELQTNN